jgi:hypothetical protein
MCQNHTGLSSANQGFSEFCVTLRRSLADAPLLDPPLAAALDLLDRRAGGNGLSWFECEVAHLAWNTSDMHSMLGAGVLLSLWNGARELAQ